MITTAAQFKQTEIGLIPEDWEVKELGELGNVIIGLTYSPNDVSEYGTLVLRSSNIQNNRLTYYNNVFVNVDLPERVIVKENDLLICVRNGSRDLIGKSVLIDKTASGCAFGAFMSIYRSDLNAYISKAFQSGIVQKQIENNLGATINQITNKDLKSFIIPLPPLQEQQAIAEALSDADAWIESLEKLIAKKRLIKQGAMQELLTPKEDWEVKKLGEVIVDIVDNRGKTPPNSQSESIELIETASVSFVDKNVDYTKVVKYVSKDIFDNWFRKHPIKGSLLVSTVGEYSGASALYFTNRGTIAQNLIALHPSSILFPEYLLYWSKSLFFKKQLKQVMMNQAQPSLKVPWLLNFIIQIPSLSEQTRIATILSDMDAELETLEKQLEKARQIKQGMMQELLTGRVRLV